MVFCFSFFVSDFNSYGLSDNEMQGTANFTVYGTTQFSDVVNLHQNNTLVNHSMPNMKINSELQQYESYLVDVEMSDFSTYSSVLEDFDDIATLNVGNWTLWTNISTYREENNFNVTGFESQHVVIEDNETVKLNLTGNYIAEYSFIYDDIGENPLGWNIEESSGTDIQVFSEMDGHLKVVEFDDKNDTEACLIYNTFDITQEYGTVEFWVRSTDVTKWTYLLIQDGHIANYAIYLNIGNDYLKYYDTDWHNIVSVSDGVWYHVRVTFECGVGGYDGLSNDTFNVYVNGIKYGAYNFRVSRENLDTFMLKSYGVHDEYYFYVDAVDYSWSEGYYTNRNYNNTYYSFTGDYLGEYSFIDDIIGENPDGWSVEENASTPVSVIENKNGHHKLVEFVDNSEMDYCSINTSFSSLTAGIVEYYVRVSDASKIFFMIFTCDGQARMAFAIWNDKFQYLDGEEMWHIITTCNNDQWYHIQIDFCSLNWNVTIDDVEYGVYPYLVSPMGYLNGIMFFTFDFQSGFTCWVDAVDFSWSDGYYLNRNCNVTDYEKYYQSSVYDLGGVGVFNEYYYENLTFYRTLNINTNLTIEYRVSKNNVTWGNWFGEYTVNQTINVCRARYFQFRVNLISFGNYTYTPELYCVNLTYQWNSYILSDEYSGVGIIRSWSDYTNYVSSVFINVSANCLNYKLKISVLSDSNNKSIILRNNTNSVIFFTEGKEFIVFELSDDYGITYIDNISFIGSGGEYWNSIVLYQNWALNVAPSDKINMQSGIIKNSEGAYVCKVENTTPYDGESHYWQFEMNSSVETVNSLYLNLSFATQELYNISDCNSYYIYYGIVLNKFSINKTVIYVWSDGLSPDENSSESVYYLFDLEEHSDYNILFNVSNDWVNYFGNIIDEYTLYKWYGFDGIANVEWDYLSFYENRTANNIYVNGTLGNQAILTFGNYNILNFSSDCSNLEFTYTVTYSLMFSGTYDWSYPSFVFTYQQLNRKVVFQNVSFSQLPAWYKVYYPDNLRYYLLVEMNNTDIVNLMTSDISCVITSMLFENYRSDLQIGVNETWNFMMILELMEDSPIGFPPVPTPMQQVSVIIMWIFLAVVGIFMCSFIVLKFIPNLSHRLESSGKYGKYNTQKFALNAKDKVIKSKDKVIKSKNEVISSISKELSEVKGKFRVYKTTIEGVLPSVQESLGNAQNFLVKTVEPMKNAMKKMGSKFRQFESKIKKVPDKVGKGINNLKENLKEKIQNVKEKVRKNG